MKRILFLALVLLGTVSLSAKNVSVTVVPATATIMQKGKVIQPVTPGVYSLNVTLGELVFVAQADGYDSEQFIINLKSPSTMQVRLKPNRKQVSLSSDPNTATIYVDGRELGKGTVDFSINKHESKTVKIEQDGYDTYIKQIGFNDQSDIKMSYNVSLEQNRREINVLLDNVPAAVFLVDGAEIAKGTNRAKFDVHKGKDVKLTIRAEGYHELEKNISFYHTESLYNLTSELKEDEMFKQSIPGADIANKDIIIHVNKNMTRDDAIQNLSYYLDDAFGELTERDNITGYYCTIWVVKPFGNRSVRTRASIKEIPNSGDGELKFKLKIRSEITDKADPSDQDYREWNRVLRIFKDVPELLANHVQ